MEPLECLQSTMMPNRKRIRLTQKDHKAKSLEERQLSTIRDVVPPDNDILLLRDFVKRYAPKTQLDAAKAKNVPNIVISPMNTIVAAPHVKQPDCREPLPSLIDDVVWTLVQRRDRLKRLGSVEGRNVLAQGYASQSIDEQGGMQLSLQMRPGVICVNPNDKVNICKSSSTFQLLHECVGDEILRMILLHTMLFVPLQHNDESSWGNFILVCGPPLVASESKLHEFTYSIHPRKRQRQGGFAIDRTTHPNGTVSRYSLFYNDSYIPKVGLPKSHPLNKPVTSEKLLGLMTDLFDERGKKRKKRWKRLRVSGLDICKLVSEGHSKCDYARLLNRYCPFPDFCANSKAHDVTLVTLVQSFTPPEAVASFLTSVLKRVFPAAFWGSDNNFSTVVESVSRFVSLRRQERLSNKDLMKGIKVTKMTWLLGTRRPGLTLSRSEHQATTTLTLGVLRWLFRGFVIPLLRANFHVTESEFRAKQLLYYRRPVWSMFRAQSMNKLLQKQFFELSTARARILISRQKMGFSQLRLLPKSTGVRPIAQLSRKPVFVIPYDHKDVDKDLQGKFNLKRSICDDDDGQQQQRSKKMKTNGLAAKRTSISALQRRVTRMPATNTVLAEVFDVLKYECSQQTRPFGAGLAGLEGFYPRYRQYILGLKQPRYNLNLCFASVDIEKCYDNINQQYLFDLVKQIISHDHYFIQQFIMFRFNENTGDLEKISKKVVDPIHQDYQDVSERFKGVVFDSRNCKVSSKNKVLGLLKEHLCSNLVAASGRYGNRTLLQTGGIPQGSILSMLLCNLYYGDMEKKLLQDLLRSWSESFMARQVDDFIFIGTDRKAASQFLGRMYEGKESLGVKINREKTLVSEPMELKLRGSDEERICLNPTWTKTRTSLFPWCGMLFDTMTGEVLMDYSRFQGGKAGGSLTVQRDGNEGHALLFRMKGFVRPRCVPILYDSSINSFNTVVTNYYQMMLFGAVKTAEYLRSSQLLQQSNPKYLLRLIDDLAEYTTIKIQSNLQKQWPAGRSNKFALGESTTGWLCWRSFHDVFLHLSDFEVLSSEILVKVSGKKANKNLENTLTQAFEQLGLSEMLDY